MVELIKFLEEAPGCRITMAIFKLTPTCTTMATTVAKGVAKDALIQRIMIWKSSHSHNCKPPIQTLPTIWEGVTLSRSYKIITNLFPILFTTWQLAQCKKVHEDTP